MFITNTVDPGLMVVWVYFQAFSGSPEKQLVACDDVHLSMGIDVVASDSLLAGVGGDEVSMCHPVVVGCYIGR